MKAISELTLQEVATEWLQYHKASQRFRAGANIILRKLETQAESLLREQGFTAALAHMEINGEKVTINLNEDACWFSV